MVLGVRGMPNVQGGVETHAEQLYSRIAELGCEVQVLVRTPFVPAGQTSFGAVRLHRIWSPTTPGLEAAIHSLLGVLYAGISRPDVLHIHAIGPAIVTPIARLLGIRTVVTHHGPDYDRDKWGSFARWVLCMGERFGMRCSSAGIAVSRVTADLVLARHHRQITVIPNGAALGEISSEVSHLEEYGVRPRAYFLQVSRMVPEKRQLDLIRAYSLAQPLDWKLVLVGGLDSGTYCKELRKAAADAGVILTGFQSGDALRQLYSHAGAFVLPSSHEGLPIAMLEALSFGLPVIASAIPANLEVGLEASSYFPLGDAQALAASLRLAAVVPEDDEARAARRQWVAEKYDWDRIAAQTMAVYRRVVDA
jgi:glycosyltransferase involved in cell wall biosynthesis